MHKYTATNKEPLNIIVDLGSFLSWGGYKEEGEERRGRGNKEGEGRG